MPAITLYGIPNCDTVKKARAWLQAHQVPAVFHDFKKQGVPDPALAAWASQLGWETLLNRKGTTWRRLDEGRRSAIVGAESALQLMREESSVIRRPVVDWGAGRVTVGFSEDVFAAHAGVA